MPPYPSPAGNTSPIGENPWLSRNELSAMLMNICVVRLFAPDVANDTVPRLLEVTTASSWMLPRDDQLACTAGSELIPNWDIKLGTFRNIRTSSQKFEEVSSWNRSTPIGAQEGRSWTRNLLDAPSSFGSRFATVNSTMLLTADSSVDPSASALVKKMERTNTATLLLNNCMIE